MEEQCVRTSGKILKKSITFGVSDRHTPRKLEEFGAMAGIPGKLATADRAVFGFLRKLRAEVLELRIEGLFKV